MTLTSLRLPAPTAFLARRGGALALVQCAVVRDLARVRGLEVLANADKSPLNCLLRRRREHLGLYLRGFWHPRDEQDLFCFWGQPMVGRGPDIDYDSSPHMFANIC